MTTLIHKDCATCDNSVAHICIDKEYMIRPMVGRIEFRADMAERSKNGEPCPYWVEKIIKE